MTKVITRAAILTGVILVTNVAVESAAPVTPVRAATARVTRELPCRRDRSASASDSRVWFGLPRRGAGVRNTPESSRGRRADCSSRGERGVRLCRGGNSSGKSEGARPCCGAFHAHHAGRIEEHYNMRTRSWVAVAPATKTKDALPSAHRLPAAQ